MKFDSKESLNTLKTIISTDVESKESDSKIYKTGTTQKPELINSKIRLKLPNNIIADKINNDYNIEYKKMTPDISILSFLLLNDKQNNNNNNKQQPVEDTENILRQELAKNLKRNILNLKKVLVLRDDLEKRLESDITQEIIHRSIISSNINNTYKSTKKSSYESKFLESLEKLKIETDTKDININTKDTKDTKEIKKRKLETLNDKNFRKLCINYLIAYTLKSDEKEEINKKLRQDVLDNKYCKENTEEFCERMFVKFYKRLESSNDEKLVEIPEQNNNNNNNINNNIQAEEVNIIQSDNNTQTEENIIQNKQNTIQTKQNTIQTEIIKTITRILVHNHTTEIKSLNDILRKNTSISNLSDKNLETKNDVYEFGLKLKTLLEN